jgi:hypothetical protein
LSPATTAQSLILTYLEFLHSDAFAALVVKELNLPDVTEDTILNSVSAVGIPKTLCFRCLNPFASALVAGRPLFSFESAAALTTPDTLIR